MLWALDVERDDGLLVVEYPYFETADPIVFGTRAARTSRPTQVFTKNLTHEWNHGLGEIVTAVLDAGMELTRLEEHTTVPWDGAARAMVDTAAARCSSPSTSSACRVSYTLQARKRG